MSIRPHNPRLTFVLAAGTLFFAGSALAQAHSAQPQLAPSAAQFAGPAATFSHFSDFSQPDLPAPHIRVRYVPPAVKPSPPANTQDQASLTVTRPAPEPSPAPSTSSSPPPSSPSVGGGGVLTPAQVGSLWLQAGGPGSQETTAECIAWQESGDNPNAYNPSGATGLMQILGQVVPGNLYDPFVNMENAVAKYNEAGGWSPWTTAGACGA